MESTLQSLTGIADEWERVRLEFVAEHDAGNRPTLDAFVERYPQYASELTDFVLDYLHTENTIERNEKRRINEGRVAETVTPYTVRVWEKTLAELGIPVTEAPKPAPLPMPDVVTFSTNTPATATILPELRKAQRLSPLTAARRLQINNSLLMRLENGRITDWSDAFGAQLKRNLATVFAMTQDMVETMLQATVAAQRTNTLSAAFSADGDPDAEAVAKNRQAESFADALQEEIARGGLTVEQIEFWKNAN